MSTILKNEFIKMLHSRKFYILSAILIACIALEYTMVHGLNAHNCVLDALGGMVMKPILPAFMVIVISDIITEDYTHGTMKFSLIAPIKRSELIAAKLLFIALYAIIFLTISFISSYILGIAFFGLESSGDFIKDLIFNLKWYASITLPLVSFCTVISFIATLINNSGEVIGAGIGFQFIMIAVNRGIKNAIYYTFEGGMYTFDIMNNISVHNILTFAITSCIYIFIFACLAAIVMKKKDIVL